VNIATILIVYGILFIGELGDKTQLIVFNLALEYNKFYKVGIGVSLGFVILVTIGVFFGTVITKFIPLFIISIVSGVIFILIGIIEALNLKKAYSERKQRENKKYDSKNPDNSIDKPDNSSIQFTKLKNNPYIAGFVYIFIMELASIYNAPIEVWIGSFLALISVAWIGILLGAFIARKVPKLYLKLISTTIFILVGILVLISSF